MVLPSLPVVSIRRVGELNIVKVLCPARYPDGGIVVDVGQFRGEIAVISINSEMGEIFIATPYKMEGSGNLNLLILKAYDNDGNELATGSNILGIVILISITPAAWPITTNLPTFQKPEPAWPVWPDEDQYQYYQDCNS